MSHDSSSALSERMPEHTLLRLPRSCGRNTHTNTHTSTQTTTHEHTNTHTSTQAAVRSLRWKRLLLAGKRDMQQVPCDSRPPCARGTTSVPLAEALDTWRHATVQRATCSVTPCSISAYTVQRPAYPVQHATNELRRTTGNTQHGNPRPTRAASPHRCVALPPVLRACCAVRRMLRCPTHAALYDACCASRVGTRQTARFARVAWRRRSRSCSARSSRLDRSRISACAMSPSTCNVQRSARRWQQISGHDRGASSCDARRRETDNAQRAARGVSPATHARTCARTHGDVLHAARMCCMPQDLLQAGPLGELSAHALIQVQQARLAEGLEHLRATGQCSVQQATSIMQRAT